MQQNQPQRQAGNPAPARVLFQMLDPSSSPPHRQLFTKIVFHKRMHFIKPCRVGSPSPKSFPLFKDTKHTGAPEESSKKCT